MNHVLDPLTRVPGVRIAVLVTSDGVPVSVRGEHAARDEDQAQIESESAESLAALAAHWHTEMSRSVAPLSWDAPEGVVLEAARGTLIMRAASGTMLFVVCQRGTSPADLKLPMEAAVARLERVLRDMGSKPAPATPPATCAEVPPRAPWPSREGGKGSDPFGADTCSQSPLSKGLE